MNSNARHRISVKQLLLGATLSIALLVIGCQSYEPSVVSGNQLVNTSWEYNGLRLSWPEGYVPTMHLRGGESDERVEQVAREIDKSMTAAAQMRTANAYRELLEIIFLENDRANKAMVIAIYTWDGEFRIGEYPSDDFNRRLRQTGLTLVETGGKAAGVKLGKIHKNELGNWTKGARTDQNGEFHDAHAWVYGTLDTYVGVRVVGPGSDVIDDARHIARNFKPL